MKSAARRPASTAAIGNGEAEASKSGRSPGSAPITGEPMPRGYSSPVRSWRHPYPSFWPASPRAGHRRRSYPARRQPCRGASPPSRGRRLYVRNPSPSGSCACLDPKPNRRRIDMAWVSAGQAECARHYRPSAPPARARQRDRAWAVSAASWDARDLHAAVPRRLGKGEGARQAVSGLARGGAGHPRDGALARHTEEHRASRGRGTAPPRRRGARLWAGVLPKPKPGSTASRDSGTPAASQAATRASRKS